VSASRLFLCLAALWGCGSGAKSEQAQVPASIVVRKETISVRRGDVGISDKMDSTYVLVDVDNQGAEDRMVAVDGTLKDKDGRELVPLAIDELRVPARSQRTFALVGAAAETAVGAEVKVRRAEVVKDEPIYVTDMQTERDGEALAATCRIKNTLERQAVVTVVASFHDAAGKIVARPFSILQVAPKSSRPFRFDGPKDATQAAIYVGDTMF
jgi:hypothetical protein